MKIYSIALLGLLVFSGIAFCQVDTMRLLEVGSVTAPGTITNWYFEDLNGDCIKEIILTTANSVNIYSGLTFAPIWSQSGFTNPKDLNFADINNDSLIDFSVKDTSHIYLIDPHHSTTIWTSPMLDESYGCYTMGDRDYDGWVDLALTSNPDIVVHSDPNIYDSVSVRIYNGPAFSEYQVCYVRIYNYSYDTYRGFHFENLTKIDFKRLNGRVARENVLLAIINILEQWTDLPRWEKHDGSLRLINLTNSSIYEIPSSGQSLYYSLLHSQDTTYFTLLGSHSYESLARGNYLSKNIIVSMSDSEIARSNIWEYSSQFGYLDWKGFVIGDIDRFIEGDEIAYGSRDSLYIKNYPWNISIGRICVINELTEVKYLYTYESGSIINSYIICLTSDDYLFIDGETGEARYFLPHGDFNLNGTTYLANVNSQNLYSINANSLYIFILAPRVNIDSPNIKPTFFSLAPNYPNPFNASTLIEYGLPEPGLVKIDIFDILGRKIQTLVDETQSAGYHQVTWKADNVPSGTYFYRIQAGEKTQTRKCLLLK